MTLNTSKIPVIPETSGIRAQVGGRKVPAFAGMTNSIVVLLFFVYFLIGVIIFKDYGVSWDEYIQRITGHVFYHYVAGIDERLLTFKVRYYGPVFEILLVALEKLFKLDDYRPIYLLRHFTTFLIFYIGTIFFYKLNRFIFKSWKLGLLATLFFILSPRIFAHSFYNCKDIPFLAMFMVGAYSMVWFLDHKTFSRALVHAIVTALVIDIRIMGILLPFMTILAFLADTLFLKNEKKSKISPYILITIYACVTFGFMILFWPTMWVNTFENLKNAFWNVGRHQWGGTLLYMGSIRDAYQIPWHYIPVWILITTPLLYIVLFVMGVISGLKLLLTNIKEYTKEKRNIVLAGFWFFAPVCAVILLQSILYDAWRHMFFVYPGFVILAIYGLKELWRYSKEKGYDFVRWTIIALLVFQIGHITKIMFDYHPLQNIYFNRLAGSSMVKIKHDYELDYWGLSYRKGLEYIVENDPSLVIPVFVENSPGHSNSYMIPLKQRQRLRYVKDIREAKYFLSNYRHHRNEYSFDNEFYAVEIDGAKVLVVYRL